MSETDTLVRCRLINIVNIQSLDNKMCSKDIVSLFYYFYY